MDFIKGIGGIGSGISSLMGAGSSTGANATGATSSTGTQGQGNGKVEEAIDTLKSLDTTSLSDEAKEALEDFTSNYQEKGEKQKKDLDTLKSANLPSKGKEAVNTLLENGPKKSEQGGNGEQGGQGSQSGNGGQGGPPPPPR